MPSAVSFLFPNLEQKSGSLVPRNQHRSMAAKQKPAAPMQQSAAVQPTPTEAKPAVAAPAIVEAKPSVQIEPTKEMPEVLGTR
jgi:hypothetical protein